MLEDIAGYLQIESWPLVPQMPFWGALALVAGALLGEGVRRAFGVPRIIGYSAVGLAIGLGGWGGGVLQGPARLVVDLALALLLFELGSRVRLRWLQANPALLATSALEAFASLAAIYLALRAFGQPVNVALACATLGTCASGAVIARVASELKSAGQVTERMIVLTALNTLLAVLAHKLVIGWLHLDVAGDWVRAVSQPLWVFGGSVLLAALLSRLVAWVARRLDLRDENAALLLLGMIVLALTIAQLLNLSTLLVPLLAGVLLRNSTERPWVWPRHFGTAGGVLVLMLFVVVGSVVTLDAVLVGGGLAIVLLLARGIAKTASVFAFARWSGIGLRQAAGLSLALTPMSGTVLVLLTDLQLTHPGFAPAVVPIVLSAIAFMELLGPLAVQWGLRLAGDHRPEPTWRAPETEVTA
ncbi:MULTISPECIES: cation:proton antiporter [Rubrivivax]|uniref:Sodium:proton exchanger n=1 Tax=Rubrivivax benzoatilyticus TaxID=316997 RepID=A0ABX0I062_9BURK|nr:MULTISPECIES: cation:proton antiporter [Rubrivivax]MCD0422880.1 cation:proton antiporter [Rubrivivax sp. JA1024]EGJ09310.1 sodium/hydrogen exchanger [Rubrivivax benzoatilyticus JA2 = ATCC BAA-35]MCC9596973.1 cation:proton antiporter [Rubrivivax sp. JA1055]MCC9649128.1 cation:proton antiporter [Rubrivivax sp. JA1029]NHK98955.1 sodium:proton exchanger [Rubrivivax benzoatilyticus]